MSVFGERVRRSIQEFSGRIVRQALEGNLSEADAVSQLATAIDMAVRRDPAFAETIGLVLADAPDDEPPSTLDVPPEGTPSIEEQWP